MPSCSPFWSTCQTVVSEAGGLSFGLFGNEFGVDFVKVVRALRSRALFGPFLPDRHEFLHAFGHERPPNGVQMGDYFLLTRFTGFSSKVLPFGSRSA